MNSRSSRSPLHDIDLHYLHVPGVGPNPYPLLLMHGWPGSVFEFLDIIPRLTDPARFGGDPRDAFTVIAPSLPGYGLSFKPGQKRFVLQDIADCLHDLMTRILGFRTFAAQGGDWGAGVASLIGQKYPSSLRASTLIFSTRHATRSVRPRRAKRDTTRRIAHLLKEETGYQQIQGTKPQTLAFGLTDFPAGLAAWIIEKFRTWSDNDGVPDSAISRDRMLANISLVLVHRCDRLFVLALLWPAAFRPADLTGSSGHGADRLCGISKGNHRAAALDRGKDLHQHPALDRDEKGWSFRGHGAAGRAGR